MASTNSTSHVRRAQIVSLTLTELMLLLVFMLVAYSFLATNDELNKVDLAKKRLIEAQAEIERLSAENNDLQTKLAVAMQDRDRYKRFLDSLNFDTATLTPKGDTIEVGGRTYTLSTTSGKAPGHPQCVLASVNLLHLTLLPGMQIQGSRLWTDADQAAVQGLPNLALLASGQPMPLEEFVAVAGAVRGASLAAGGCTFGVRVTLQTSDAYEFNAELKAVERNFHARRD